ncbi:acyl-CoA dehydrogenase family protein [Streptomyces capillispiralis]|uniref:Acyl-coenzyme A oxidase n=1 Tax=Streptomyces capillispiralis TaxID=68182 RepID=A0A561TRT0_9ACTN|nr:acyl-CoA dehydrogenase [Streptomyces capillispiralis]TWF89823.1 acyl-coenzyme A oxidase [Streptomyces capillispiralis]GHE23993.1 acyl-CoA oxidase [Streptomyces capillispiralis]
MIDNHLPTPQQGLSNDLTTALFGSRAATFHQPWKRLFGSSPFSYREGLTHEERIQLSYERLRLVNDAVDDPAAFAGDPAALSAMHEWAGVVDAGMATCASIHYNLFLGSLLDHDHQDRDLTEYLDMSRVGTFLCTELGHGNDAAQMETTCTFDRNTGGFVLDTPTPDACKWMPNTSSVGGAKSAVVAARLRVDDRDLGVFLFLTPLSDAHGTPLPGVEIRRLPQTASSPVDHCATSFHQVPLPYGALLQGEHGRLTRDGRFTSDLGSPRKRFLRSIGRVTMGKLCMSAYSLGATRHALTVAVRHAHNRHTSGMTGGQRVPLFAHRSHHAPLLEATATAYAATLLQRDVTRQWADATDDDREHHERLVAVAKGWITWQARAIMTECRERCGAQGLILANGIAGQLAANEGTITAEGDNKVIWVKAAGEMLLGGFTPQPVSELPPEQRLLDDPRYVQDLLGDIERIWHERARARLRTGRAPSPLARWNATVTPALQLVDAHAHRLAGQALSAAAAEAGGAQSRSLLTDLHRLFALRRIAAHSGDLLAQGRITAEQVQHLPDAIDNVVMALEPHALTLVAGFDVPEELLEGHPVLQTADAAELVPA